MATIERFKKRRGTKMVRQLTDERLEVVGKYNGQSVLTPPARLGASRLVTLDRPYQTVKIGGSELRLYLIETRCQRGLIAVAVNSKPRLIKNRQELGDFVNIVAM